MSSAALTVAAALVSAAVVTPVARAVQCSLSVAKVLARRAIQRPLRRTESKLLSIQQHKCVCARACVVCVVCVGVHGDRDQRSCTDSITHHLASDTSSTTHRHTPSTSFIINTLTSGTNTSRHQLHHTPSHLKHQLFHQQHSHLRHRLHYTPSHPRYRLALPPSRPYVGGLKVPPSMTTSTTLDPPPKAPETPMSESLEKQVAKELVSRMDSYNGLTTLGAILVASGMFIFSQVRCRRES
jgi:hypothetical protein